jgi:hypothetical protein
MRYTKRHLRPYMNQDNQAVLLYNMLKIRISTQNIPEICYGILRTSVTRFIGYTEKSVYTENQNCLTTFNKLCSFQF